MALHRLRAHMRFPEGHWGPQWCYDQMTVRYGQATHIRQGEPSEESPVNIVDGAFFRCDLPLVDESAALDALATLSDQNILGQTIPIEPGEDYEPSWVEYHLCDHEDDVRSGCQVIALENGP